MTGNRNTPNFDLLSSVHVIDNKCSFQLVHTLMAHRQRNLKQRPSYHEANTLSVAPRRAYAAADNEDDDNGEKQNRSTEGCSKFKVREHDKLR